MRPRTNAVVILVLVMSSFLDTGRIEGVDSSEPATGRSDQTSSNAERAAQPDTPLKGVGQLRLVVEQTFGKQLPLERDVEIDNIDICLIHMIFVSLVLIH